MPGADNPVLIDRAPAMLSAVNGRAGRATSAGRRTCGPTTAGRDRLRWAHQPLVAVMLAWERQTAIGEP